MQYLTLQNAWLEATGNTSSQKQLLRRVHDGQNGIHLKARFMNGCYKTTLEWVEEFLAASSEAKLQASNSAPATRKLSIAKRLEASDKALKKLGLL